MPSARSWWRSTHAGSWGRGNPSRRNPGPSYASWHDEHPSKATRGDPNLGTGSPQRYMRGEGGRLENGGGNNRTRVQRTPRESGSSPKVLLSKDGSMRVEFTNTRVVPVEQPATTPPPVPEPSLRTSKGSSFSSDGSWYDSPWGTDDVFVCGEGGANSSGYTTYSSNRTEETTPANSRGYAAFFSTRVDVSPKCNSGLLFPAAETAARYTTCSSGRTEDSGIGDSVILQPDLSDFSLVSPHSVDSNHNTLPAFPTTLDATAPLSDVIQEEEGSGGGVEHPYSSLTLPCRSTSGNNRKDFLKSRIRRLSDWTGSLSRKKRRLQVRLADSRRTTPHRKVFNSTFQFFYN